MALILEKKLSFNDTGWAKEERACSENLKEQYYMRKRIILLMKKKGQKACNKNLILIIWFLYNVVLKFVSVL